MHVFYNTVSSLQFLFSRLSISIYCLQEYVPTHTYMQIYHYCSSYSLSICSYFFFRHSAQRFSPLTFLTSLVDLHLSHFWFSMVFLYSWLEISIYVTSCQVKRYIFTFTHLRTWLSCSTLNAPDVFWNHASSALDYNSLHLRMPGMARVFFSPYIYMYVYYNPR
jgi:hypothetical protein